MDRPALQPGEQVLVTSADVYVKSIRFMAVLTSARIILLSVDEPRMQDKDLLRETIEDISSWEMPSGDLVLTLLARSRLGETRKLNLFFPASAGQSRESERAGWIRYLTEGYPAPPVQVPKSPRPAPARGEAKVPYTEGKLRFHDGIHVAKTNAPPAAREYPTVYPQKSGTAAQPARYSQKAPVARPPEAHRVNIEIRGGTYVPRNSVPPASAAQEDDPCFCTRCGSRVTGDSPICKRCGTRVIAPVNGGTALPELPVCPREDILPVSGKPRSPVITFHEDRARPDPLPGSYTSLSPPSIRKPVPELYPEILSGSPGNGLRSREAPVPGPRFTMSRKNGGLVVAVAILVFAVSAVFFLFPGMMAIDNSTHVMASGEPHQPVPVVTTTPRALVKGGGQATGTVNPAAVLPDETGAVPPDGIYVRVAYSGTWQGNYGTVSSTAQVKSSGEKIYPVTDRQEPVVASIKKTDTAGGDLVVGIYCDGQEVKSASTSDPAGSVSVTAEV